MQTLHRLELEWARQTVPRRRTISSSRLNPIKLLLDLGDIPVIFASLVLAYHVRFHSGVFPVESLIPPVQTYLKTFALVSLFWFGVLLATDTYGREPGFSMEHAFHILRSIFLGAGLGMMAAFLYRGFSYSRLTIALGLALATVCLWAWHFVKALVFRRLQTKGVGVVRAVLVGDGKLARECVEQLRKSEAPGLVLVGFCGRRDGMLDGELPDLGPLEKLRDVVRDQQLDRVLIALPSSDSERTLEIVRELEE
ncbi:MAG: hypothetical protein HY815_06890, partial [Candidatus Riflebacteria bacterium]|nr:hypothetical protein [Candidatus Riflebacteria bacterium]